MKLYYSNLSTSTGLHKYTELMMEVHHISATKQAINVVGFQSRCWTVFNYSVGNYWRQYRWLQEVNPLSWLMYNKEQWSLQKLRASCSHFRALRLSKKYFSPKLHEALSREVLTLFKRSLPTKTKQNNIHHLGEKESFLKEAKWSINTLKCWFSTWQFFTECKLVVLSNKSWSKTNSETIASFLWTYLEADKVLSESRKCNVQNLKTVCWFIFLLLLQSNLKK